MDIKRAPTVSDYTDWLTAQRMSESRVRRFFMHPFKNALIGALRTSGAKMRIAAPLFWQHRFNGFIPEAVTSLVWRHAFYEQATTYFLLKHLKPGDVFVDIGAHFGYFTLLASSIVGDSGKVVAIEAMPATFAQLQKNIAANNLANVMARNMAAYSEACTLQFKHFDPVYSSLNTCGEVRGVLEGKTKNAPMIDVAAMTADAMLAEAAVRHVSMMKIDAESSEEQVLVGLKETLATHKPTLLIELGGMDAGEAARIERITQTLANAGYQSFRQAADFSLTPITPENFSEFGNVIFMHESRLK